MSARKCTACGADIIFALRRPEDPSHPWEVLNVREIPPQRRDPEDWSHRVLTEAGESWPPKEVAKLAAAHDDITENEGMNIAHEYPWYTVHRCRRGSR